MEGHVPIKLTLGDAPTYRPTEQEWVDPIRYLQSIREQAAQYGIIKIVPPSPPERLQGVRRLGFRETTMKTFDAIDPKAFTFRTKLQKIHQLQSRYGPNETFINDLQKFLEKKGTPLPGIPRLDGKDLDLYKLFRTVLARGGSRKVADTKKWNEVAETLLVNVEGAIIQHVYNTWLLAYERRYKRRLSQSPAEKGRSSSFASKQQAKKQKTAESPVKNEPTTPLISSSTPTFSCRRCCRPVPILEEAIQEHLDFHFAKDVASGCSAPSADVRSIAPRYALGGGGPPPRNKSNGVHNTNATPTTPVAPTNSSTITSPITPTNGAVTPTATSPTTITPTPVSVATPSPVFIPSTTPITPPTPSATIPTPTSPTTTTTIATTSPTAAMPPPTTPSLTPTVRKRKRTMASMPAIPLFNSPNVSPLSFEILKKEDVKGKRGRRSANKDEDDDDMDVESIVCTACSGGDDEDKMLLCDSKGCENAYHMYCCKTPLSAIPRGEWFCDECIEEIKEKKDEDRRKKRAQSKGVVAEDDLREDFGFLDGKIFSMEEFEAMANNFKKKWFRTATPSAIPVDQIEQEFWRIVNTAEEYVQVHYGSDIDSGSAKVSGFPDPIGIPELDCGWNLKLLAKVEGSPLRCLQGPIAGVTVPMLYVGMCFSSFCWHNEDNYLYSINYLHKGAPKAWYGVPGGAAHKFEEVMKAAVPDLFAENPDLLHHLTTMLCPSVLIAQGVPIYHLVQEEGEMVITFPQAYHAGLNSGFNVAESVNFATPDWLPYGRRAMSRYRKMKRAVVFSHQELLVAAMQHEPESFELASRLRQEFQAMIDEEQRLRDEVLSEGVDSCLRMEEPPPGSDIETKQCAECMTDCYLSALSCFCKEDVVVCLRHSKKLCKCEAKQKIIVVKHTLTELENMLKAYDAKLLALRVPPAQSSGTSTLPPTVNGCGNGQPKPVYHTRQRSRGMK